jgi:anhydro-N-acetylmuramic acid kinase
MTGPRKKGLIVAGVMSGTSADGINVALVRVNESPSASRRRGARAYTSFALIGHAEYPYSKKVRAAILAAMNASSARVADLARLNFLLGELYADAIIATQKKFKTKGQLIGCHGQTLYHQGEPAPFLGLRLTATWQTGEAAIIAARVGVPVVSDFRPADMAAKGKGAPLVPFLDYLLFRDARVGRIVQNIGGIANLTAIPAGADAHEIIAFDTGPGNMLIDALTTRLFGKPYDRNGKIAASGSVLDSFVTKTIQHDFFRAKPPKTAGREQFGREFVSTFLQMCDRARKQDVIATATAFTARSIADAVQRFVQPRAKSKSYREIILSGGGAKNLTLVAMLRHELIPLQLHLRLSDEFGLPSEAKEAVAFAVLAHETWHRRPSNVPSATGATRPAVLGKISFP